MGNTKDVMEKINSWNSFLFHHAERYNREVAMTATYILEVDSIKAKKVAALLKTGKSKAEAEKGSELTVDEKKAASLP
jgi:hypothetical protein